VNNKEYDIEYKDHECILHASESYVVVDDDVVTEMMSKTSIEFMHC
jgi:hypothetical protein